MRREHRLLPDEGIPGVNSLAHGYNAFRKRNAVRCRCGHERFHHAGLRAPGCSYAGACPCPAFRRGTVAGWPTP